MSHIGLKKKKLWFLKKTKLWIPQSHVLEQTLQLPVDKRNSDMKFQKLFHKSSFLTIGLVPFGASVDLDQPAPNMKQSRQKHPWNFNYLGQFPRMKSDVYM